MAFLSRGSLFAYFTLTSIPAESSIKWHEHGFYSEIFKSDELNRDCCKTLINEAKRTLPNIDTQCPAGGKKWPKIIVETSVKIVIIRRNMKKIFKGLIFAYAMFFSGHAINAVDTPAGAGDNADVKISIYEKEDSAFLEKIKKAENTFSLEVSNRLNSFLATDSCVMCSIVEIEETIVAIIAKRKSGNVLICDFIYKDETLSLDDIAAIECGPHKMIEIINS